VSSKYGESHPKTTVKESKEVPRTSSREPPPEAKARAAVLRLEQQLERQPLPRYALAVSSASPCCRNRVAPTER
jgi:hypothetical protein